MARRYPKSDKSLPAQYARAIVAYRTGGMRDAIRAVDALIAQAPDYPYFHELKGQILFESGKAREAIAPLRKAASLAPRPGLIRIMLGSAELGTNDDGQLDNAIADLRAGLARSRSPRSATASSPSLTSIRARWRMRSLPAPKGSLIEGDIDLAKNFAKRAQGQLKVGSPGWLKADDIVNYESPDRIDGLSGGPKREDRTMSALLRIAAAALAMIFLAAPSQAAMDAMQKQEIETIVHDYLLANPEVLEQAFKQLQDKRAKEAAVEAVEAIAKSGDLIFNSPNQMVLGNPKGTITLVEFFDYNCGYCKRAVSDMMALLDANPDLRIVMKEFPILSEGSVEAARISVAMKDTDPAQYWSSTRSFFPGPASANGAKALEVAKDLGLDVDKLKTAAGATERHRQHQGSAQARRDTRHQRHAVLRDRHGARAGRARLRCAAGEGGGDAEMRRDGMRIG